MAKFPTLGINFSHGGINFEYPVDSYSKAESDEKFATNNALQELSGTVGSISNNLTSEIQRALLSESEISHRIDTIVQGRNVRDIVGSYAELEAYDTSTLGDNDIIMVLLDNTKSGHTTYYRWKQNEGEWEFIGGLAFTYTKTEIDDKFRALHIVLPTVPADAEEHPEDYQELLAQVDTMVRSAGADASFKMPIVDVGNVDVTFVKTNPANVYLGVFADDHSYLYHIARTISTPRTYTCEVVEKIFANAEELAALEAKIETAEQTADKVSDIDNVPEELESQKYPNVGAVRQFVNNNKQLFVAEYRVTTAEEIIAAYNAGKEVICIYKTITGISGIYSQLTFASSNIIKFYGHSGSLLDSATLILNISNGVWSRATGGSETTLTPTTASDDRVPTSKAVVKYVSSLEWDGTQAEYDALTVKNPNVTYFIHE